MQKIIGVTELQRHFKAALDDVVKGGVSYVVARGSRPEAALISYEDYLRFQKLDQKEGEFRQRWAELRNRLAEQTRDLTDEEVEAEVAAAVAEVRAERRAREQAQAR